MELDETRIGRARSQDRQAASDAARGRRRGDASASDARSDATGLCVIERAPWGVIGMVLPATHSVPTMVSNAINIIAAGNTAVFSPHPGGREVSPPTPCSSSTARSSAKWASRNVITMAAEPSIETAEADLPASRTSRCCASPAARGWCRPRRSPASASSPAGPAIRPWWWTRRRISTLPRGAIIEGAAFDNNLLCIGEKEVFVVASVADAFIAAMRQRRRLSSSTARPSSG